MLTQTDKAKAWCFDNGVTKEEVEKAWANALEQNNMIIRNMHRHGHVWHKLPVHLLGDLLRKYGKKTE